MDLRLGGKIAFYDAEGTTYEGTITELEKPYVFGFGEVDDRVNISLQAEDQGLGRQLTFVEKTRWR